MKLYNKILLFALYIILFIILYRISFLVDPDIPLISNKMNTFEIVIAVYEEDISWLDKIPSDNYSHMYIYNKGKPKKYNFPKSTVIDLPNEGYEAKTYLTHITTRYDNLADMTLFIPGTAWTRDYKREKLIYTIDFLSRNNESVIIGTNDDDIIESEKEFFIDSYSYSNLENRKNNPESKLDPALLRPYGRWFEYMFGDEKHKCVSSNGIFSASRTDILKRTKDFYLKLLLQLNSKSPESGHYIERSWANIVSIPGENCKEGYQSSFYKQIVDFFHLRYNILQNIYNGSPTPKLLV